MPVIAFLIAGGIGWALWSGQIRTAQLPPLILALAGTFLALKGQIVVGAVAVAIGITWFRGMHWRLFGMKSKQSGQYELDKARNLLGVGAFDDVERIRARHRQLIADNHPDRGGSDARAAELNKARDLLLSDLAGIAE